MDKPILYYWAPCRTCSFATQYANEHGIELDLRDVEQEGPYQELLALASEYGFDCAAPMDATKLEVLEDVRAACEKNLCGAYNKTWACPPAFGDLETSRAILKKYRRGLLVQSVQELEDDFDWEGIEALGKRHGENFGRLRERIRELSPITFASNS